MNDQQRKKREAQIKKHLHFDGTKLAESYPTADGDHYVVRNEPKKQPKRSGDK